MSKRNPWKELLDIANADLIKNDKRIDVSKDEDENFSVIITTPSDGHQEVFAENYYEDELRDVIDDAWVNVRCSIRKAKERKKERGREWLHKETIAILSADIYESLYSPDDGMNCTATAAEIVRLAKRFEEELNWQGEDDNRDYILELERFENKVLFEKGLPKKTLAAMVSDNCYNEIVEKLKEHVGASVFAYIFPAVKKALEEGSGEVRETILSNWLDIDSCRVCSHCGAIMQEGWYLDCQGYACSDECAMEIMNVPDIEHFHRYRIYKEDIDAFLEEEGEGRKEEDLTQEEIEEIIDTVSDDMQACYTEWY